MIDAIINIILYKCVNVCGIWKGSLLVSYLRINNVLKEDFIILVLYIQIFVG